MRKTYYALDMILKRHSSKYRELLWQACANDGEGHVLCNICGLEVIPGDAWHESHVGAPAALGGNSVGIAHAKCNLEDGRQVTSFVAKTKRMKRNHLGITGPGLGASPMAAGRRSRISKKLNGEVVVRKSQSEKHREMMERRTQS